jgi:hypothetical protein
LRPTRLRTAYGSKIAASPGSERGSEESTSEASGLCYYQNVFASPAYCACFLIARSKTPPLVELARPPLCKFRKKLN